MAGGEQAIYDGALASLGGAGEQDARVLRNVGGVRALGKRFDPLYSGALCEPDVCFFSPFLLCSIEGIILNLVWILRAWVVRVWSVWFVRVAWVVRVEWVARVAWVIKVG